jgi:tripartite ATP-independent transporter DctP family solute receptor
MATDGGRSQSNTSNRHQEPVQTGRQGEKTSMAITRRKLLGSAAAATALSYLGARPAQAAAEFVLKYGNDNLPAHPMNLRLKQAADGIAWGTQGRVQLQIFPGNTLGADTQMLSQLRSGALQMVSLGGNVLSTLVPVASITGMAFSFGDYDAVWKAMDGELGAMIRTAISQAGLATLDKVWDNGFRQITSSVKPIHTPEDLVGFKIRVPVSPVWTSTFVSLGASPLSLNANEMYSALQTRIADGQENSLTVIDTYKLYEVQKYCSLTNHMWEGYWPLINVPSWAKLPADLRTIVAARLNAAALAARADVAQQSTALQSQLGAKGLIFNSVDVGSFKAKLRSAHYYEYWKKRFGDAAWSVYTKAGGNPG